MILGVSEQFLAGAGAAITLVGAIGIALLRFVLQALKEIKQVNKAVNKVPEGTATISDRVTKIEILSEVHAKEHKSDNKKMRDCVNRIDVRIDKMDGRIDEMYGIISRVFDERKESKPVSEERRTG